MKKLKIILVKSPVGRLPRHRKSVRALGLTKLHQAVSKSDTPQIRGMIKQIEYLVRVEDDESK